MTRLLPLAVRAFAVAALALPLACARGDDEAGKTDPASGGSAAAPDAGPVERRSGASLQGVATFTADEVGKIVDALSSTATAQASLGAERATSRDVKSYAETSLRARTAARERLRVIVGQELLGATSDTTSRLLDAESARTYEALREEADAGFELAFMTSEIAGQARLLGLLEASLLPSAEWAAAGEGGEAKESLARELQILHQEIAQNLAYALRVQGIVRASTPAAPAVH